MKNRRVAPLLTILALIVFVTACSSGNPTPAATTSIDGVTLVQQRCTVCHPLQRVESSRFSAAQWKTVVDTMISHGAQLTPSEETIVVNYLAANFGQ